MKLKKDGTPKKSGGVRVNTGRKETCVNQTPASYKIDNDLITPFAEYCKANNLKKNKALNIAIRTLLGIE